MADFHQRPRFGGAPQRSFGSRPSFGNRSNGDRQLHEAECASCGTGCQVPFKPNGKKPVYCKDCFAKEEGQSDRYDRGSDRGFGHKREFSPRPFGARPSAPAAPSRETAELIRKVDTLVATVERLAAVLEGSARASALSAAVTRSLDDAEAVPAKKAAAKSAKKTVAKKTAKRSAK
jgi:CxxC-x17-CxxC domain-containing protein